MRRNRRTTDAPFHPAVVARNSERSGSGNHSRVRVIFRISCHLSGAWRAFLVLYAREIHIDNLGWFFVTSGTTSLLARPLLGKVSDRIGRRRALLACFVLQALALMSLAFASSLSGLIIPGMLYMVGLAMASATTLAIAMEQAKPERRGRAMATFSVALPLSNGIGALICGGLVQSMGFFWMYLLIAGFAGGGLLLTIANRAHLK